jgi:hypothetical protein
MNTMTIDAVSRVTVILALILMLSFVIERILELLKAGYDMADGRYNLYEFWTRKARKTQQYIEKRLRVFNYVDKAAAASLLSRFDEMMLGASASGTKPTVPVLCGDLVRVVWCRATLKFIGAGLGIWVAFAFGLDLLALSRVPPNAQTIVPGFFGTLATGIAIGLGSGIVHKLITTVERRQRRNAEGAGA